MPIDPELAAFLREGRQDREAMRQDREAMRQLIDANNRVVAENSEELRAFREESREFRAESRAFREAHANDRTVLLDLSASIRAMIDETRRHNDAVVGALTDLAAEIRGWGGASQN